MRTGMRRADCAPVRPRSWSGSLVPDFAPGGCTDHVVLVSDGCTVCEIKPSNVDAVVKRAPRALG